MQKLNQVPSMAQMPESARTPQIAQTPQAPGMQVVKPAKTAAQSRVESLIGRLGAQWGVDAAKLRATLVSTVFRQGDGSQPTNEELMVVLLVCEQFALNPFAREIFAFKAKSGQIVPVVSLDGWAKIVRRQKDFNGMRFRMSERTVKVAGTDLPEWCECQIFLKGIEQPVCIQEYTEECYNERSPVWHKWPRRMLRTRAFIQAARLAFSLTGLYDEGDAFQVPDPGVQQGFAAAEPPALAGEPVREIAAPAAPSAESASTARAEERLNLLLRSRGIPDFWNRAAKAASRAADLSPEERRYVVQRLEEVRRAEAQEPAEEAGAAAGQVQSPADEAPAAADLA